MLHPPLFFFLGKGLLFCWKNTQPPWDEHQYSISSCWRDLPCGKAEKLPSLAQIQTELHQNSPLCKNSRLRAPSSQSQSWVPKLPVRTLEAVKSAAACTLRAGDVSPSSFGWTGGRLVTCFGEAPPLPSRGTNLRGWADRGLQFRRLSGRNKMAAATTEEDTELRDLLVQTLETSGVLNKIKVKGAKGGAKPWL